MSKSTQVEALDAAQELLGELYEDMCNIATPQTLERIAEVEDMCIMALDELAE